MDEVTGPIIAIALVLCAVFIPTAFISGLSGQFYKQFAITIAISTIISAFNSLTLSPALSAVLLKPHRRRPSSPRQSHDSPAAQSMQPVLSSLHPKEDWLTRTIDRLLGPFFRLFNRFFDWSSNQYALGLGAVIRRSSIALLVYAGLIALAWYGFKTVPTGFVPTADKQYLVAFAQLPDAASLDRTEEVMRRMSDLALKHPGVADAIAFPGLSINGFTVSPNSGIVFVGLKSFHDRETPDARDIVRRAVNLPALGRNLGGGRIDIVDADITEPGGGHLHFECAFRHGHQSGDRQFADAEQRVADIGHAGIAGSPADDVLVERFRRGHVRRHQFIPNEFAVICHCLAPVCFGAARPAPLGCMLEWTVVG